MAWKGSLATTVDALSLVVVIAAAVLVGGHFFREPAGSPEAASEFDDNPVISLVDVPLLGSRSADVILLEFSDYECPYCRRHATGAFKQLKTEFIDTGSDPVRIQQQSPGNDTSSGETPGYGGGVCRSAGPILGDARGALRS